VPAPAADAEPGRHEPDRHDHDRHDAGRHDAGRHDAGRHEPDRFDADEVELAVVTLRFDAADAEALAAVLARYVVLTRMVDGCRNVDLCSSVTRPGRFLVIQKWASPEAQRAHFDSDLMVDMARACTGLLAGPPDVDLWDGPSAHDLA
jgi:quinol monooxygenase YgiN